jgi:arabinose-5-phosphate isomerase
MASARVQRPQTATSADVMAVARDVLTCEADAIRQLVDRIDAEFARAVSLIAETRGRLVVTGLGKSGAIGRKLAATFASLGTPAFFVHAAEAAHGDAGMITPDDVVLALSNSGETAEVRWLAEEVRRQGAKLVTMTGCSGRSALAAGADVCLDVSVDREADPDDLAPTASTAATLAMGDALAVALAVHRGWTPADFARCHPGGALGERLASGPGA